MAKYVIIFGAGASADFGGPLMSNFMDVAQSLYGAGNLGTHASAFKNVFRAKAQLQAVHSKAEFDLINIESLFTAFELAKTLQKFPGREPGELDQLLDDLKRLIVVTLEQRIQFRVQAGHARGHDDIIRFVSTLSKHYVSKPDRTFAFMTFNYDLILDFAFTDAGTPIDYALAADVAPASSTPLLKLHGSINWAKTSKPDIVPWRIDRYRETNNHFLTGDNRPVLAELGSNIQNYKRWLADGETIDPLPVLVPPSWNKAESHRSISSVWARAAKELGEAESIFVVGYSLPLTDTFFKQLYAIGAAGDVPLKRFWVYNPDATRESSYRSMLGPGALPRFRYCPYRLPQAIGEISEAIVHD